MKELFEMKRPDHSAGRRKALLDYFDTLKQYAVVNDCLQLIGKCKMNTVTRLTVESKLIRIKTLLLDRGALEPREGGQERFVRLFRQVRRLTVNGCDKATVDELMEKVRGVLTALDRTDEGQTS